LPEACHCHAGAASHGESERGCACVCGREGDERSRTTELIEWAIIVTAAAFSIAALRPIRSIRLSLSRDSFVASFVASFIPSPARCLCHLPVHRALVQATEIRVDTVLSWSRRRLRSMFVRGWFDARCSRRANVAELERPAASSRRHLDAVHRRHDRYAKHAAWLCARAWVRAPCLLRCRSRRAKSPTPCVCDTRRAHAASWADSWRRCRSSKTRRSLCIRRLAHVSVVVFITTSRSTIRCSTRRTCPTYVVRSLARSAA